MKSLVLGRIVNAATFGRVKYGWWTARWQSRQRPIIIAGCGRSGTTLLRAMLNAHPNIFIGPETDIFRIPPSPHHGLERLARAAGTDPALLHIDYLQSACLGEFIERMMSRSARAAGKGRWGEKTPRHVHYLALIFRLFPEARFIHVIRDGRDVVCSLRHHPEFFWKDGRRVPTHKVNRWDECVSRWVDDTTAGLAWSGDPRYRAVRYESLVADPEASLRGILHWLSEDWDDSVLSYYDSHQEQGSDVANPGVRMPVYAHAVAKWPKALTPEALEYFTEDAHRLLMDLGYAEDRSWADELTGERVS